MLTRTGVQNRRLSPKVVPEGYPKPSGNEGVPKQSFGSQTEGYQSKALDRKTPCKTSCKTTFCKPEAANLWFASLTKQSFVWRQNFVQNFVLQAIQSLQSFACKNSVFASTSFVRRLQAFGLQTKGLHEVFGSTR